METILGKVIEISAVGERRYRVACTPACLLPGHNGVPDWLVNATLTIEREVVDRRELGGPGDSIVLEPGESAQYLYPLSVTPAIAYGDVPDVIQVTLAWWKDDAPPPFSVSFDEQRWEGQFSREDNRFVADVVTAGLLPADMTLPLDVTVSCGELSVTCTVVPADVPFVHPLLLPEGEVIRLENQWYRIDASRSHGGVILGWQERGRGIDHYAQPADRVGERLRLAGHADWYRAGWHPSPKLHAVVMPEVNSWRDECSSHLTMSGEVGKSPGTELVCVLDDKLPLLLWRRAYYLRRKREKQNRPHEPIDDVRSFGVSFRGTWIAEHRGDSGSRILCAYGDQLVTYRGVQVSHRDQAYGWRMEYGWTLVEHPCRHACSLYLFPPHPAPVLESCTEALTMSLQPIWPMVPAREGDTFNLPLAIVHGECCGASPAGAWVGCRTLLKDGTLRCAVIARLRESKTGQAVFRLDDAEERLPLRYRPLAEIGEIAFAIADFPGGRLQGSLEINVAGIPQRRPA